MIHLAMVRISGSRMPRVVRAGLPMRMPLGFSGRIGVVGNGVLVYRDAGLVQGVLGFAAQHPLGENIDQHQVGVGAAGDDAVAFSHQGFRQGLRIHYHLLRVLLEARRRSPRERPRPCRL